MKMAIADIVHFAPRDRGFCLAQWRVLLGDAMEPLRPHFEKIVGQTDGMYPMHSGKVYCEVRKNGGRWIGVPIDGSGTSADKPCLDLALEDVQMWRLSEAGWALAEKLAGCSEKAGSQRTCDASPDGGEVDVRIIGDYKAIRIRGREIDLSRKYKARDVLRYLHGRHKNTDGVFRFEEVKEDFNSRFGKGEEKRRWKSDRFREDLFRGMSKEDFDCLFETLDQTAGRYRLKI